MEELINDLGGEIIHVLNLTPNYRGLNYFKCKINNGKLLEERWENCLSSRVCAVLSKGSFSIRDYKENKE